MNEKRGVKKSHSPLKKLLTNRYILWYSINTSKGAIFFVCLFIEGGLYIPKYREVPLMRVKITLACTECKQRNYNTMKNKKNDPDRLEMNKYCRFCKKHTLHKETK